MPPKGRLADKVIDDFRKWINTGAKIPASFQTNGSVTTATINWESALKHWAYQPLSEALPPVVTTKGWDTNNIDLYVLQKLEENGLSPPPLQIHRLSFAALSSTSLAFLPHLTS